MNNLNVAPPTAFYTPVPVYPPEFADPAFVLSVFYCCYLTEITRSFEL